MYHPGDTCCWASFYVKAKKPQTANAAIAAAADAILTAFFSNFSAVGHFPGAGLALALFFPGKTRGGEAVNGMET